MHRIDIIVKNGDKIIMYDYAGVKIILDGNVIGFYNSKENFEHYVSVNEFARAEIFISEDK